MGAQQQGPGLCPSSPAQPCWRSPGPIQKPREPSVSPTGLTPGPPRLLQSHLPQKCVLSCPSLPPLNRQPSTPPPAPTPLAGLDSAPLLGSPSPPTHFPIYPEKVLSETWVRSLPTSNSAATHYQQKKHLFPSLAFQNNDTFAKHCPRACVYMNIDLDLLLNTITSLK